MPVKIRHQTEFLHAFYYEHLAGGNVDFHLDIPGFEYDAHLERISYENVGKQRMTSCLHEKHTAVPYVSSGVHVDQDNAYFGHQGTYPVGLANLSAETKYDIPGLTQEQWVTFIRTASRAMIPSMKGSFEAPTFIRELPEVRELYLPWVHRLEKDNRLARAIDFFRKKKFIPRSFLKTASKAHLTYAFAIAPLLSDAQKIAEIILDFREKLAAFRKLLGHPVTLHFAMDNPGDLISLPEDAFIPDGAHLHKEVNYRWITKPRVYATMKCIATCPAVDTAYFEVLAWLDAFGVGLNPVIIWDAIPFSFVIDWFFDIGGRLEQYRLDNLDVTVIVQDFCVSQKFEYTWKQRWQLGPGEIPTTLWRGTYKRYERIRCLPDFNPTAITGAIPSLNQVLLGASLLNANRH